MNTENKLTGSLLGKQSFITNKLKKLSTSQNKVLNKFVYLSGEMGSGKTYMTSALIASLDDSQSVIIVVPPLVQEKWKNVLQTFTNKHIRFYNKHTNDFSGITIMKHSQFHVFSQRYTPEFIKSNHISMMIYDEIHMMTASKLAGLQHIQDVHNKLPLANVPFSVALTGTIFNNNFMKLGELLFTTHPMLITRSISDRSSMKSAFRKTYANDIYRFMANIWQYISLSISIDDVNLQKNDDNDIHQEIEPIQPITMTREESLVYSLNFLQVRAHTSEERAYARASALLDNPLDESSIYSYSKRATRRSLKKKYEIVTSLPLTSTELSKTQKYQSLIDILNNQNTSSQEGPTLIYALDDALMERLANTLVSEKFDAVYIDTQSIQHEGIKIVQDALASHDIVITNPLTISVGVDLSAATLVWYQLIDDVQTLLQAQRRIYRMNSTVKTHVYLLAYDESHQSSLVKEISNSAKYNAASHGSNLRDNLTKLTGYIIPEF